MTQTTQNFNKLSALLLHCKLITKKQFEEISKDTSLNKKYFLEYLIDHKIINNRDFMIKSANLLRLQYIDINAINIKHLPKEYFNFKSCSENKYLPLFTRNKTTYVAVANPIESHQIIKQLRHIYNSSFVPVIAELYPLKKKIEEYNEHLKEEGEINSSNLNEGIKINSEFDLEFSDELDLGSAHSLSDDKNEDEDAPIIRFINSTIIDAIQKRASDIHFEPYEKMFRIRYRVDGLLSEVFNTKKNIAPKVISRLKVMASLDIAEKRIPQDGKFKISLSHEKDIDFRVSTCPVSFGEKVVLRILDPTSTQIPIEELGFSENQKLTYLEYIKKPQGMVIVTGPTGSGKTVTLYTGINILNQIEKNISTAEDPVELIVPGINQVSINNKTGLTFSAALKAFLRQDPDIIMVGEIRDLETGAIAMKAAQTGHLVMSTLHTNSAPETLNRLVDMGLPSYNVATSVTLIIAQRLIRKLCPHCKVIDKDTKFSMVIEDSGLNDTILSKTFEKTLDEIKNAKIYKANHKGCSRCFQGYKGRLGVYEIMPVSKQISKMILEGKNTMDIAIQAQKEGVATVRQSALVRVSEGLTSMEETYRVS